jgi:hypothetical protein
MLRYLAAVLVVVSLSLSFAAGQTDAPVTVERGVRVETTEEQKGSTSPAALPHVVLALSAMLVLTIVCMPSRKA